MPHLYPAETVSYMKKKGMPLPLTIAVMTDYTCIPFWEETCCDYYIVPHPELIDECAKRGIPQEKMIPFGIPVSRKFRELEDQEKAKEELGFSPEKKLHLLIGGSMGAGNLEKLAREVRKRNGEESELAVICGNNEKIREQLEKRFAEVETGLRHRLHRSDAALYGSGGYRLYEARRAYFHGDGGGRKVPGSYLSDPGL